MPVKERPELLKETVELELKQGDRFIDIFVKGRKRIEVKCWKNFWRKTFLEQFIKDLKAIDKPEDLEWIFDSKMDFDLKNEVMEALKSAEGREALKGIDKNKAEIFLKKSLGDASESVIAEEFINYFNKNENFNLIFK